MPYVRPTLSPASSAGPTSLPSFITKTSYVSPSPSPLKSSSSPAPAVASTSASASASAESSLPASDSASASTTRSPLAPQTDYELARPLSTPPYRHSSPPSSSNSHSGHSQVQAQAQAPTPSHLQGEGQGQGQSQSHVGGGALAHRRTNSLKRKPVPSYIALPPTSKLDSQPFELSPTSPASPSTPNSSTNAPPPPRSLIRGGGLPPPPRRAPAMNKVDSNSSAVGSVTGRGADGGVGTQPHSPSHLQSHPLLQSHSQTRLKPGRNTPLSTKSQVNLASASTTSVVLDDFGGPVMGNRDEDGDDAQAGYQEVIRDVERGQGRPSTFESQDGTVPAFGDRRSAPSQAEAGQAEGYFPGMKRDVQQTTNASRPASDVPTSVGLSRATTSPSGRLDSMKPTHPHGQHSGQINRSQSTQRAPASGSGPPPRLNSITRRISQKSLPPLPSEAVANRKGDSEDGNGHSKQDSVSTTATAVLKTPTSLNGHPIPDHHPWAARSGSPGVSGMTEQKTIRSVEPPSPAPSARTPSAPDHRPSVPSSSSSASFLSFRKGNKSKDEKHKDSVLRGPSSKLRVSAQPTPIPERVGSLATDPVTSDGSASVRNPAADEPALIAEDESDGKQPFSADKIPSQRRLWEAGTHFLRNEDGELVSFSELFPRVPQSGFSGHSVPLVGSDTSDSGKGRNTADVAGHHNHSAAVESEAKAVTNSATAAPRTVLLFIRHFWCGQCQDYMQSSISQLDPDAVAASNIRVVVISCGSWKIIKSYKRLFQCPFEVYVDAPRRLYQLMGMTKMTNDFGPWFSGRAAYNTRSVPRQLLAGGKNAITKMPLAFPGKLTQLGGEFVLAPGYVCEFAHRMSNTSNHMEAPEVLRIAGCAHPTKSEIAEFRLAADQKEELERMEKEMQSWRQEREAEIERIQRRKAERRGMVSPVPHSPDEDVHHSDDYGYMEAGAGRGNSSLERHGEGPSSTNTLGRGSLSVVAHDQEDDSGAGVEGWDEAYEDAQDQDQDQEEQTRELAEEMDRLFVEAMQEEGVVLKDGLVVYGTEGR